MPNPNYYVTFFSKNPPLKVTCLLDTPPAQVTEGYGGWTEVDRARRRSLTLYTGPKTYKMTVPVLFDNFIHQKDIMGDIRILERMASPGEGVSPPPVIHIVGAVPGTQLDWVINDLKWGSQTERSIGGALLRQDIVVELWEYVPNDVIQETSASKVRAASARGSKRSGGGKGPRTYTRTSYGYSPDQASLPQANTVYTAQAGDTMTSIATDQLGDWQAWADIAAMNNLRDPNAKFNGGEKLRLPA